MIYCSEVTSGVPLVPPRVPSHVLPLEKASSTRFAGLCCSTTTLIVLVNHCCRSVLRLR